MNTKTYNTPMNGFYNFTPKFAFDNIKAYWTTWHKTVNPNYYIIGISGGIDSTCVAAITSCIFGKDKVIGVSLPCNGQKDIADVDKVFEFLNIKRINIDIGDAFNSLINNIENNAINITDICKTNMPVRLRMTTLYGVAQCCNGIVVNTCNRSESVCGNDTLFGDDCGSYAPIQSLTKTEVKQIANWLNVPTELVNKTPIDGLQPLSDEERLGLTYKTIDDFIRSTGKISDNDRSKILNLYCKNKFKLETINIAGPNFNHYPDMLRAMYGK